MDNSQRFDDARKVTEEIQQTTREDLEVLKSEELYEPDRRFEPQKEDKQSTNTKVGERVRGWVNEGKARVQNFNERHPNASKYAGYAAKGIGVVGRNTPLGRAAWAVSKTPDAYQYGKQVWNFVKEAKAVRQAEEKASQGKAFYELAAKSREREIAKLEGRINRAYDGGKLEKPWLVDEVRHSNQEKIDWLKKDLESVKHSRSLKEVLSENAKSSDLNTRFEQSRNIADEYRKTQMKGLVEDKYHYLLDETRRELGDNYYDLAKHPQRATNFDAFAAKRLYEDGASKEAVRQTIENGAFYPSIKQSNYAREYGERTYSAIPKESELIRENIKDWQFEQARGLEGAKINPDELGKFKEYKAQAQAYEVAKTKEVRELAQDTLQRYKADNAQWKEISTKDEYLLEMGRRMEGGKVPDDNRVATKLMLAGHDEKYISGTLKEYSPKMNNSQRLSDDFMRELKAQSQQNHQYLQELEEVKNFREQYSVSKSETRLDRLQLSYDQKEGNFNYETFKNTTKEILESKPTTRSSEGQINNTTRQIIDSTSHPSRDSYEIDR
ncbi:MAG: hypothetical protein HC930_01580 [Hydrococcus sp. SU_1_0]|nr:hypothetical protein [Hydrococcus sp. SU_1_0]